MSFFNFPIRRPVTIVMWMLIISVVGIIALWRLPLEMMPEIEFPQLTVVTGYSGAGPEEVEKRLTKPLEEVIRTVPDIKNVKSISSEGMSVLICEFNWGTDLDTASNDIRDRIERVKDYLPEEAEQPFIFKINVQEMPVVILHLIGEGRGRFELGKMADDIVSPLLERVPGVASAMVMGKLDREIKVEVNKDKLLAYGLDLTDIVNAIRYHNLDMTIGHINLPRTRLEIKAKGEFTDLEELRNLVVGYGISPAQRQNLELKKALRMAQPLEGKGSVSPIRLRDVAEVIDGYEEVEESIRRIEEGKTYSGVALIVMKESDANIVETARNIEETLPDIQKRLPEEVKLIESIDMSDFITDSINALKRAAYEGAIGAGLVLLLFLFSFAPTLIVAVSIPLSLLIAFACIYFAGYSLNMITLGALVVALGKLVDDSIVVVENTFRYLEKGWEPRRAAEQGVREVAIAITGATVVAVIIFLPLAFIRGLSSQLFRPFAVTFFFALMGSLLVAFTIVPMLCSRFLRPRPAVRKSGKPKKQVFSHIQNAYAWILAWTLDNRGKVLALAVLVLVFTLVVLKYKIPTQFMAEADVGAYQITMKLPTGTPYKETEKVVKSIEDQIIKTFPDLKASVEIIGESSDPRRAVMSGGKAMGTNDARLIFLFKKKSEGGFNRFPQVRAFWDEIEKQLPSAQIAFANMGMESAMGGERKPVEIKIFGEDLQVLRKIAEELADRLKNIEGIRDVTTSMEEKAPREEFFFDRTLLSSYGLVTAQAEMTMNTALDGQIASRYREAGDEYDIRVRFREQDRDDLKDIENIPLSSPFGFQLPARAVGKFRSSLTPVFIERENSKRMVTVEASKTERPLSEIIKDVNQVLESYPFPEQYFYEFGGDWEDKQEAFADLGIMLILSVFLVYMVLASLYESLVHPFTIMSAIPFAFTGALIALWITNTPLDTSAYIGMIMLVGIVATNSIVLIDFVLEYHRQGMPRREAVIEAGRVRLRPILMTALTTMLGVFPIALALEEGMEMQQPLGIAVFGGLFSSTILTLLIVPAIYTIIDDIAEDLKMLVRRVFRREKPQEMKS